MLVWFFLIVQADFKLAYIAKVDQDALSQLPEPASSTSFGLQFYFPLSIDISYPHSNLTRWFVL